MTRKMTKTTEYLINAILKDLYNIEDEIVKLTKKNDFYINKEDDEKELFSLNKEEIKARLINYIDDLKYLKDTYKVEGFYTTDANIEATKKMIKVVL